MTSGGVATFLPHKTLCNFLDKPNSKLSQQMFLRQKNTLPYTHSHVPGLLNQAVLFLVPEEGMAPCLWGFCSGCDLGYLNCAPLYYNVSSTSPVSIEIMHNFLISFKISLNFPTSRPKCIWFDVITVGFFIIMAHLEVVTCLVPHLRPYLRPHFRPL